MKIASLWEMNMEIYNIKKQYVWFVRNKCFQTRVVLCPCIYSQGTAQNNEFID
jgi:hypothetical protein